MRFGRKLACSFCGKSEDEVRKLVAGAHAYICDACVAIAERIMREHDGRGTQPAAMPGPETTPVPPS